MFVERAAVGLKALISAERPQERMLRCGAQVLSDAELLALLLRSGSARADVLEVARNLLLRAGSLAGLMRMDVADFQEQPGLGVVKSLQLVALVEVARRMWAERDTGPAIIDGAEAAYRYFRPHLGGRETEEFWVLCLNRRNAVRAARKVTSGTATASLVHAREVFREAIRLGSTAIIVAHNHPSGDASPSRADFQVTEALREASEVLDIPLLDHLVIGAPGTGKHGQGFFSFAEAGLL